VSFELKKVYQLTDRLFLLIIFKFNITYTTTFLLYKTAQNQNSYFIFLYLIKTGAIAKAKTANTK